MFGSENPRYVVKNYYLQRLELVSKELNHSAVILHVYAGVYFYEVKKCIIIFQKRYGKYFYTFNHFYSKKVFKKSKITQIYY